MYLLACMVCLVTLVLTLSLCHGRRLRRNERANSRNVPFFFSATAVLKPQRTTQLEVFVPSPPDGDFGGEPTILREFFQETTRASCDPQDTNNLAAPPSLNAVPEPASRAAHATLASGRAPTAIQNTISHDVEHVAMTRRHGQVARSARNQQLKITFCEVDSGSHRNVQSLHSSPEDRDHSQAVSTGKHPPNKRLKRNRVVRPAPPGEDAPFGIETTWFEISGTNPVDHPPDLTGQGNLEPGDLFYYRHVTDAELSRLWIWDDDDDDHGGPRWKVMNIGDPRKKDLRVITLTEKRKNPSWIGEKWYARRMHENSDPPPPVPRSLLAVSPLSHTEQAYLPPLAEYRLSQSAIEQLGRISDANSDDDAESAYADALRELEALNSCNAALYRAVLDLKRGLVQRALDSRMSHIEEELATVRQDCDNYTRPARLSYRQAQGIVPPVSPLDFNLSKHADQLKRERDALESFRHECEGSLERLTSRMHSMELDVSVLKTRSIFNESKEDVEDVLNSIRVWAEKTTERLDALEEDLTTPTDVSHSEEHSVRSTHGLNNASISEVHGHQVGCNIPANLPHDVLIALLGVSLYELRAA
ncbi:hypothetical protein FKP32DRAFT_1607220 [Trametes sanguinea]|nr:hypothetical protein FKP32DRAFT_1607220 [Trametes sanguinea]